MREQRPHGIGMIELQVMVSHAPNWLAGHRLKLGGLPTKGRLAGHRRIAGMKADFKSFGPKASQQSLVSGKRYVVVNVARMARRSTGYRKIIGRRYSPLFFQRAA